eukprot:3295459-Pleurochrysis_carterae.AAC.1
MQAATAWREGLSPQRASRASARTQTATQPSWLAERTHDGCSVVVASAETADWCSPTSCSCGRVKLTLRTKPSAPPEKSAEAPCDQLRAACTLSWG